MIFPRSASQVATGTQTEDDLAVVDTASDRTFVYNSIADAGTLIPRSAFTTQLVGSNPSAATPLGFELPVTAIVKETAPGLLTVSTTGRPILRRFPPRRPASRSSLSERSPQVRRRGDCSFDAVTVSRLIRSFLSVRSPRTRWGPCYEDQRRTGRNDTRGRVVASGAEIG